MIRSGRWAASLVILLLVLAAGCAPAASGPGGLATLGRTSAGVIGSYVPATLAQLADGDDFQQSLGTLEKEAFENCIRGFGFGPAAQAFAFQSINYLPFQAMTGYTSYQNAAVGLVDVHSVTKTGMLAPIYIAGQRPDSSGISPAEQRAIRADQWHCWSASQQPVRKLNQQGYAIHRQWYAQEVRLLNSKQVRAATKVFGSCVSHEGAPKTAAQSLGQFLNWLQRTINRGAFVSGVGSSGASVQPRQRVDAHWSAVFVRCGGPLVSLLQRLLPGAQQAFVQEHFGQIAALNKIATQTMTELERKTGSQL
jgi:hypothetical protein